jgi:predicted DNA-binding protein
MFSETINPLTDEHILKYPDCPFLPKLGLSHSKEGIDYIQYTCYNNHHIQPNLSLKDTLIESNSNRITLSKCKYCRKEKRLEYNLEFYYCCECDYFICENCMPLHSDKFNNNHTLVALQKYILLCNEHNQYLDFFCPNCNKTLCTICVNEHPIEHKIYNIETFKLNEKEMEKLKDKIKISAEFIKKVEEYCRNTIKEIEDLIMIPFQKFKEMNLLELKFLIQLLENYQKKDREKDLNFQVIQNLRSFMKFNDLTEFRKTIDNISHPIKKFNFLFKYLNSNNWLMPDTSFEKKKREIVEIQLYLL